VPFFIIYTVDSCCRPLSTFNVSFCSCSHHSFTKLTWHLCWLCLLSYWVSWFILVTI